jgi:hypothetical protein
VQPRHAHLVAAGGGAIVNVLAVLGKAPGAGSLPTLLREPCAIFVSGSAHPAGRAMLLQLEETRMSSQLGDVASPGRPELCEVSAGVYAYIQPDGTWWINNTGFLVGPQGVISIDSCSTRRRTKAYQDAIAR